MRVAGVSLSDKSDMKSFFVLALAVCLLPAMVWSANGQCLTKEDISKLLQRTSQPPPVQPNLKLRNELVKLATETQEMVGDYLHAEQKKDSLAKKLTEQNEKNTARLCAAIKEFGWPTSGLVDEGGVGAAFFLLKTSVPYEMQRDLLPVIVASSKTDPNQKPEFAGLIDRLRISAGMKQLFGTQAESMNGLLVVYPIEDEAHVDELRARYNLAPMADHIKTLERQYQTPVIRAHILPSSQINSSLRKTISTEINSTLIDAPTVSEEDIIRTNTNLVNLNVSVFNQTSRTLVSSLTQEDFQVFEDGQEQSISYFASTDVPFDLVLLMDLSGSTERKRDLIRESTKRFIEATRPGDRIALEVFSDNVTVVSPLTSDRAQLLNAAKTIRGGGGSKVWDALKFAIDDIDAHKTPERRRAIVFMTDGVDNALSFFDGIGSDLSFGDLLEAVRVTDTLIVPIYLDTESDDSPTSYTKRIYQNARKTLALLASESGGSYYKAKKVSDLNGVYEQVVNDLGKVYSLGYKPSNSKIDNTWRSVTIKILNRADLVPHARPGYYAK